MTGWRALALVVAVLVLAACGGEGGGVAPDVPSDTAAADSVGDTAVPPADVLADGMGDVPHAPDVAPDAAVPSADAVSDAQPDVAADVPKPDGLPRALPFAFTREDEGAPLTDQEVREFTARLTGFWKQIDYFQWVLRTSTGAQGDSGALDYRIWWDDPILVKEGDKVTFRHCQYGGDHNIHIGTSKVLSQAIAAYLGAGDPAAGRVAEQYCKGFVQSMKGMVYDENDTVEHLMARNVYTFDQEYTDEEGHHVAVDYSACRSSYVAWNTNRFEYPNNPYWGDVWVTNERSKDDICHIFRMLTFLPYVVEDAPDESVRAACGEAWRLLQLFSKDIVDSGYYVRTKGPDGAIYIPKGPDKDLASFVNYIGMDPRNECAARMGAALVGYGDPQGNDEVCGNGFGSMYDTFANLAHYYNQDIVRNFHMAGAGLALMRWELPAARAMLEGLAVRADHVMHPPAEEPGVKEDRWDEDVAVLLVQSAALGLPLTSAEARKVMHHYDVSVSTYATFENWNVWERPDGEYGRGGGYRPGRADDAVELVDLFYPMEYCASPFRNPAGRSPVACDIVTNRALWGTTGE